VIDVVSDLIGEIVEFREWSNGRSYGGGTSSYMLRARGVVRAVYADAKHGGVRVVLERNGETDANHGDTSEGGLGSFSLDDGLVRVVARCRKCFQYDWKGFLDTHGPVPHIDTTLSYEHKAGKGCKVVGSGG